MQVRTPVLAALIAGPVIGVLMGIAADPTMVPPPEPTWRKAQHNSSDPDPIYADSRVFAESPPQDLSPTWWTDHLPTWKRRALEAEWRRLTYEPEPLSALDPEPVTEPATESVPALAAVDEEAGESHDAAAAQGLEPADPRPAFADASEQAAQAADAAPQTISLSAAPPQTWPN
jgi:hypothetical protein